MVKTRADPRADLACRRSGYWRGLGCLKVCRENYSANILGGEQDRRKGRPECADESRRIGSESRVLEVEVGMFGSALFFLGVEEGRVWRV